jgi:hypothetical protein
MSTALEYSHNYVIESTCDSIFDNAAILQSTIQCNNSLYKLTAASAATVCIEQRRVLIYGIIPEPVQINRSRIDQVGMLSRRYALCKFVRVHPGQHVWYTR